MRAWLLAREGWLEEALSGCAAARWGGPWSPPGLPAVYAYEGPEAAALALFARLGVAPGRLRGYRFYALELPVPLVATHAGWDRPREVGAHFLQAGRHLGLRVPSRLAPFAWLLLLNPRHLAFDRVAVREVGEL